MMDKEKWKIPKSIATESTPGVVLEKYSKYFKEPEGMTTISLDDGRGEKSKPQNPLLNTLTKKQSLLLCILGCTIVLLFILVVYEKEGIEILDDSFAYQRKISLKYEDFATNKTVVAAYLQCNVTKNFEACCKSNNYHIEGCSVKKVLEWLHLSNQKQTTPAIPSKSHPIEEATTTETELPYTSDVFSQNQIFTKIFPEIKVQFYGVASKAVEDTPDIMESLGMFGHLNAMFKRSVPSDDLCVTPAKSESGKAGSSKCNEEGDKSEVTKNKIAMTKTTKDQNVESAEGATTETSKRTETTTKYNKVSTDTTLTEETVHNLKRTPTEVSSNTLQEKNSSNSSSTIHSTTEVLPSSSTSKFTTGQASETEIIPSTRSTTTSPQNDSTRNPSQKSSPEEESDKNYEQQEVTTNNPLVSTSSSLEQSKTTETVTTISTRASKDTITFSQTVSTTKANDVTSTTANLTSRSSDGGQQKAKASLLKTAENYSNGDMGTLNNITTEPNEEALLSSSATDRSTMKTTSTEGRLGTLTTDKATITAPIKQQTTTNDEPNFSMKHTTIADIDLTTSSVYTKAHSIFDITRNPVTKLAVPTLTSTATATSIEDQATTIDFLFSLTQPTDDQDNRGPFDVLKTKSNQFLTTEDYSDSDIQNTNLDESATKMLASTTQNLELLTSAHVRPNEAARESNKQTSSSDEKGENTTKDSLLNSVHRFNITSTEAKDENLSHVTESISTSVKTSIEYEAISTTMTDSDEMDLSVTTTTSTNFDDDTGPILKFFPFSFSTNISEDAEEDPTTSTTVPHESFSSKMIAKTTAKPSLNTRTNSEKARKQNIQAAFSEEIQATQTKENSFPCVPWNVPMLPQYYQTPPSFFSPQNDQLKVVNVPFPKQKGQIVILNPPVVNYGPPYVMAPQAFPQVGSSFGGLSQSVAGSLQAMDPKGQYYSCVAIPAPSPHITSIQGVEVRKPSDLFSLQDVLFRNVNKHRGHHQEPLVCPIDYVSCSDNSKCIRRNNLCDGEADCKDGSDEAGCSCKDRVEVFRHCDGYLDCPDGEDEVGCFGCSKEEFSCNDWNPRFKRGTCIPMKQRCDGIEQCPVGYDETDCSILTDTIQEHGVFKVSNAVGFLNRNYRGKWYPTCFGTEIWAMEVCKTESGPNPHHLPANRNIIETHSHYTGKYIEETETDGLHLIDRCAVEGTATFVQCPPLICGIRLKIHNPYRPQEIETSNEIIEEAHSRNVHEEILGDARIVGGEGSQPAAWPWVVSVYKNGVFHCSGVVVSELWIVSAAHCVDKYWIHYYEINAGALRRFSYAPQTQRRWVTHAIPHPHYNKSTLQHDISLLKLSSPLRYNRYVRPICLPTEATAGGDFFNVPYPGTKCTVVGWGATTEHSPDPDHLREVQVPVLPMCKYEEDRETNAICAGLSEGGKDACQGDSGGPFMCLNPRQPNQWYLAGVVSHGEGCARQNEPGVYTRVSLYVEWILEFLNSQQQLPAQTPLQKCPGYVCEATNSCLPKKRHCDKMVDCFLGDDERNCDSWKLDDYFKHMEAMVGVAPAADNELVGQPPTPEPAAPRSGRFVCRRLRQAIPSRKRCDRVPDCEDGTDELDCTCRDYLLGVHSDAVCDGISDCADLSDEKGCPKCEDTQFRCRLNFKCVALGKRCDGFADCPSGEDEWDCLALSNGTAVTLDADGRPELRKSGIVVSNFRGGWNVACNAQQEFEKQAQIAAYVCDYLSFNDYYKFKVFPSSKLRRKPLASLSNHSNPVAVKMSDNCSLLYVKCSDDITHPKMSHFVGNEAEAEQQFYTPWNAAIFVDGVYQCTGVLIGPSWAITSSKCFHQTLGNQSYITALLGLGKAHLDVEGPYEQILPVVDHIRVPGSDAMLLRLQKQVVHTRYVRPLTFKTRAEIYHERCIASGIDQDKRIKSIKLKADFRKCKTSMKCVKRKVATEEEGCQSKSWSGVIVCESGGGWYPSATFTEEKGYCGFNDFSKFPALYPFKGRIAALVKNSTERPLPKCNGFRCKVGRCIDATKACDSMPDCRSAEDESHCKQYNTRHLSPKGDNSTSEVASPAPRKPCTKAELQCATGKCVEKSSFCNGVDDCGDGSDEPARCTCREFLKVAEPGKVCDGVVHCRDSGDEQFCGCDGRNFQCGSGHTCVANATVCDGVYDCPEGEDEAHCVSLERFGGEGTSGEVITRTAGIWHSGCFPKTMPKDKLRQICKLLHMKGENAKQLRTDRPEVTGRAVYDKFSVVPISRNKNRTVWLRMRTGHNPYITFSNSTGKVCYKLFIECQ